MYIQLIRNQPKGSGITGRLVIDGRWFCSTLEREGYEIPALCYPVRVTQSPKFKRLLPLVTDVPQRTGIRFHVGTKPEHSTGCILVPDREIEELLTSHILEAQNEKEEIIMEVFDFRPAAIIDTLDLRRPIYGKTALEGHFGVADRPWEQTDLACELKKLANI